MGGALSAEADGDALPSTGKALSVKIQCSHDGSSFDVTELRGFAVTSDWTALHLYQAIELETGIHRQCQKLMFAGRQMEDDCTILSITRAKIEQLPERISLFLLVDKDSFPQKLGPFRPVRVPFEPRDFEIPKLTEQLRMQGFYWQMKTGVLEGYGLCAKAVCLTGQVSPASPVTQDAEQREAADIPADATEFAFSYPVADWERVETDAYAMGNWQTMNMLEGAASMKSFLSVGGYIYLGAEGQVVGVTTLGRPQEGDPGGMHFRNPERWNYEWTEILFQQGRFQNITIRSCVDLGAKMFCWLRPNEQLKLDDGTALDMQPEIPYGGFVYLFHEEVLSMDKQKLCLDRYFPLMHQQAVAKPTDHKGNIFRPFSLVDGDTSLLPGGAVVKGVPAGALGADSTDPQPLYEAENEDACSDDDFVMSTPGNSPLPDPKG
eukprot:TRINITY_DN72989_c0_g1_i1.p1 TRINITY_DN72989_c0_g1~~TRINITY_DN72989_c0_g1_i1.p1  ORF type:complete len:453 (+),score=90.33 TRINITY_DN72989_c0_g1_i1:55-1359(+)